MSTVVICFCNKRRKEVLQYAEPEQLPKIGRETERVLSPIWPMPRVKNRPNRPLPSTACSAAVAGEDKEEHSQLLHVSTGECTAVLDDHS